MSVAERVTNWNRWYDTLPEEWRFQLILWALLALGTVNMMLTVAAGFPFALLVILGIIAVTSIRVPYVLGWVASAASGSDDQRFRIEGADWLIGLNHRYEALPESRRFWVFPTVLLIGGAINMALTIKYGFPFGLLFLIVLLVLVGLRAPYTAGWLQASGPNAMPASPGSSDQVPPPTSGGHDQSAPDGSSSVP